MSLVLAFITTCEERGFLEIGLDLDKITALDYEAITALAHAQQHANRTGRQLRIRTANAAMRIALTGCHLDC